MIMIILMLACGGCGDGKETGNEDTAQQES